MAEVLETHMDEATLGEEGKADARVLDALIFGAGEQYCGLGERAEGV